MFLVILFAEAISLTSVNANEPDWAERLQYRLFLLKNTSLSSDAQLEGAKQQLQRAAITGYNCVVLAASENLVQPQKAGDEYLARLRLLRAEADRLGIGLVPSVMPFDAPDLTLPFDPYLAEGMLVREVPHVVVNNEAQLVPDPVIPLINSGWEQGERAVIPGWELPPERPGRVITIDSRQAAYGNASLRLENAGRPNETVSFWVSQNMILPPFRRFRIRVSVKSRESDIGTGFYLGVSGEGKYHGICGLATDGTTDWLTHELVLNSVEGGKIELRLGLFDRSSTSRVMWFDDLSIEPMGLSNVLRRPDCPIVVRNFRGRKYEEGRDYELTEKQAPVWQRGTGFAGSPQPAVLQIGAGSRIGSGERLLVSYYALSAQPREVVSLCMTSDRVYDFFQRGMLPLQDAIEPFGYLLATRHIGMAGWDEPCILRKKTPSMIWGDSLKRQIEIVQSQSPGATSFVWSDMYEPWNNPQPGDSGKRVCRTFEDAWRYLPQDLVVINGNCGADEARSPKFLASSGFRQIVSGDTKVGKWMQANAGIPGVVGVMNIDAPLDEFAAKAWGWLPQEVRTNLPPAPKPEVGRHRRTRTTTPSDRATPPASPPKIRTWTDATGQHKVEAAFIKVKASVLTLRKRDGSEITIHLKQLSEEDRRWLFREVVK